MTGTGKGKNVPGTVETNGAYIHLLTLVVRNTDLFNLLVGIQMTPVEHGLT